MSGHKRKSQRGTSLGCPARTWFKAKLGIVTMVTIASLTTACHKLRVQVGQGRRRT